MSARWCQTDDLRVIAHRHAGVQRTKLVAQLSKSSSQ